MEEYEKNLRNIRRHFDDPAIIVGFRRHDTMLLSLYKQYLQQGGTAPLDRFFNPGDSETIVRREDLLFKKRLQYLEDRFSRIFVYTQEEMSDRLPRLTEDLARFLGVPVPASEEVTESRKNVSVRGEFQVRLLRRLNRINRKLNTTPWLPSLDNRLFDWLDLSPRRLTQRRLAGVESSPMTLPPDLQSCLEKEFEGDWAYVRQWTENRMDYRFSTR
ncbi:MAG: hypothetical protein U5K31_02540 [Balneolaceae bacterium]|nr:hypothetical protein [Balneolaceae bacterium]